MSWFLYIIRCSDDSFYTKNKIPVKFVYQDDMVNQSEAGKREAQIKRLKRKEKLALVGVL